MSIESVMPSNHLILCRPLLLLPSIFSSIRIFSNELAVRIRWPKYWSFSFSNSPSNKYLGLISVDHLFWSPCCPRDSQESSPAPQFESIKPSAKRQPRDDPLLSISTKHFAEVLEIPTLSLQWPVVAIIPSLSCELEAFRGCRVVGAPLIWSCVCLSCRSSPKFLAYWGHFPLLSPQTGFLCLFPYFSGYFNETWKAQALPRWTKFLLLKLDCALNFPLREIQLCIELSP